MFISFIVLFINAIFFISSFLLRKRAIIDPVMIQRTKKKIMFQNYEISTHTHTQRYFDSGREECIIFYILWNLKFQNSLFKSTEFFKMTVYVNTYKTMYNSKRFLVQN